MPTLGDYLPNLKDAIGKRFESPARPILKKPKKSRAYLVIDFKLFSTRHGSPKHDGIDYLFQPRDQIDMIVEVEDRSRQTWDFENHTYDKQAESFSQS